ncbi:hypothetical protein BD626DRAFT_576922 [Schizophyllum amplum]|uniref:Uncharacterized protein n=1 Tax=Schizophyllum amplum TaxID=97359 RepID=A0A550BSZ3_9AGAR|nr:hypothetical protein BD626DRAFT_576922 [Auriculariopsis ampla]
MSYMESFWVHQLLLTLQGPDDSLTDVEYSRLVSYVARIKVLKGWNHKPEVHPLIDERLLRSAPQKRPILPNMHTLHIGWATETTLDGIDTEVQASDNGSDVVLAMVHDYYSFTPLETLGVFAPISHIRSLAKAPPVTLPGPVPKKSPALAPGFPLHLHELQHYDLRLRDSIDEWKWEAGQLEARRFFRLLRDRVDCNSLTMLRVTTGRGGDIHPRKLFWDLRGATACNFSLSSHTEPSSPLDNIPHPHQAHTHALARGLVTLPAASLPCPRPGTSLHALATFKPSHGPNVSFSLSKMTPFQHRPNIVADGCKSTHIRAGVPVNRWGSLGQAMVVWGDGERGGLRGNVAAHEGEVAMTGLGETQDCSDGFGESGMTDEWVLELTVLSYFDPPACSAALYLDGFRALT